MPKMRVLPFPGTDLASASDGWVDIDVKDDFDALAWCCNHAGLIEIADYGNSRVVSDGLINWYA